jgi:hypothetical protein
MSKMIPVRIGTSAPASERRVFDLLRTDPDTEDWTVLHSIGLAHRGKRPYGEIDFVVLVPGAGIVCLEVKGGRVRCEGGMWFTRDRNDREAALSRSPVMQAREGMFALSNGLRAHFGKESLEGSVVVASAVVFPDVPAPPAGIEAESWELIGWETLTRQPVSKTIRSVLRHQRERLAHNHEGPEGAALRNIRSFLRPDFDLVVARSTTIQRAEEQLVRLTEGQFDILDNLEINDRCVVDGAAGTGKTLVALELARRAGDAGHRPILLCFNRLLGRWIEREMSGSSTCAGSYHRVVRRLINSSSVRAAFDADARVTGDQPDFAEWPAYALESLSEIGTVGDLLIVDEGQDLADDVNLCVLDAMLEGGLAGGKWVLLGDFTRQAIFGGARAAKGFAGFEQSLRRRAPHFTTLRLTMNCRNTRQIAEETAMMSGFANMPYRLNAAEGSPVDFRYWNSEDDQLSQLDHSIGELLRDGVQPEQITLLSPVRLGNSVVGKLVTRGRHVVDVTNDVSGPSGDELRFSTIQAFKGMETPVAILTDLAGTEEVERHALLYVGMSRARTYLVMFLHQSIKPYVEAAFRRRVLESK